MADVQRVPAPGLGLSGDVLLNRDTGCASWDGPVSSDGYPVQYCQGRQEVAHRVAYETCYARLPVWARLRRVCPNPQCVHPFHYVLRAPRSVVRRLNWPVEEMHGIRELLRAWSKCRPDFRLGWDPAGKLSFFYFPPATANSVAAQLGVPLVLVLAAYADLVLATERRGRRHASEQLSGS